MMEQCDPGDAGYGLLQELELLGDQLLELRGESRRVSSRVREALHQPDGHRVVQDEEDDGNRTGRSLPGAKSQSPSDHHDIHLGSDQLVSERWKLIGLPFRPAILDRHGLALDPAQLTKTSIERQFREHRWGAAVPEISDPRDPGRLRLSNERRGKRTNR